MMKSDAGEHATSVVHDLAVAAAAAAAIETPPSLIHQIPSASNSSAIPILLEAKQKAVANEDYLHAAELKEQINEMIGALVAEKDQAVADEDYLRAAGLKKQIEEYTREATPSKASRPSYRSPPAPPPPAQHEIDNYQIQQERMNQHHQHQMQMQMVDDQQHHQQQQQQQQQHEFHQPPSLSTSRLTTTADLDRKSQLVARVQMQHRLLKAPPFTGQFSGRDFRKVKSKYQQHLCQTNGCKKKIRTYCSCERGKWLCNDCFVDHVLAEQAEVQVAELSCTMAPPPPPEIKRDEEQELVGKIIEEAEAVAEPATAEDGVLTSV